jgi:putative membrane protein
MQQVNDTIRKRMDFLEHFRWKILVLRFAVNALALLATTLLVKNIYFVGDSLGQKLGSLLLMAAMLGVLNALVKPVIQFLTMPFLFASYGLIVVVINALMLKILALVFPYRYTVNGLLWALLAGALIGLISSFLENLLGVTPPIRPGALGAGEKAASPLGDRVLARMAKQPEPLGVPTSTTNPDAEPVEVTNATIEPGQSQGEPAAPAGL